MSEQFVVQSSSICSERSHINVVIYKHKRTIEYTFNYGEFSFTLSNLIYLTLKLDGP